MYTNMNCGIVSEINKNIIDLFTLAIIYFYFTITNNVFSWNGVTKNALFNIIIYDK